MSANKTPIVGFQKAVAISALALLVLSGCGGGSSGGDGGGGGGTIPAPSISVSPTSINFGSQLVGTTSSGQTVTVTNTGTAPLSVSTIAVTGANAAAFSQSNSCTAGVAPSGTCLVSVLFAPSTSGSFSASLNIASNAASSPTLVVMSGAGTSSVATVSPSSLAFDNQAIGTTSTGQTITVSNAGTAPLSVASVTVSGADAISFAQVNTCGAPVSPGSSCTATITFAPTSAGPKSATFSLNFTTGPVATVPLSGAGVASPNAVVTPTALSFGDQAVNVASQARTITVTNSGTESLIVSLVSVIGAGASLFSQSNNCNAAVAVNSACSIDVVFTPTSIGAVSAAISIVTNNGNVTATLSGTGAAIQPPPQPAALTVSPSSISFGVQPVNSTSTPKTIVVANPGGTPITISTILLSGSNAFTQNSSCGATLAAASSCTVSVTFSPAAGGTASATLTVVNSSSTNPVVSLTGTGTAPSVVVSPPTLDFGSQSVGTSSPIQTIIVRNDGTAPLTVSSVSVSGLGASSFGQTNSCGAAIDSGGTCTINVTFTPIVSGPLTATVAISTNTGRNPTVSLYGSGGLYTIGGTVTGLEAGIALKLVNNGADYLTVTSSGAFAFPTGVPFNGAYSVTIASAPFHVCTIFNGAGTNVSQDVSNVNVVCTPTSTFYQVRGTVSGLAPSKSLVLSVCEYQIPGFRETFQLDANGEFEFPNRSVCTDVKVATQPPGQACIVSDSSVGGEVVTATIVCAGGGPPYVYVANVGDSTVSQYSSGLNGLLIPLDPPSVSTVAPAHPFAVVVDHTNSYVYVLNGGTDTISQFRIGANGTLTPLSPFSVSAGTSVNKLVASPNGPYVYATNSNTFTDTRVIVQFRIENGGQLSLISPPTVPIPPGESPGSLAFTPTAGDAYFAGSCVYRYSVLSGALTRAPGCAPLLGNSPRVAAGLAIDPTATYVYVAHDAFYDARRPVVSRYAIGVDGSLSAIDSSPNQEIPPGFAEAIAIDPQGRCAYVLSSWTDVTGSAKAWITALGVGPTAVGPGICGGTTQSLPFRIANDWYATDIAIDPTGRYAYLSNVNENAVSMFKILSDGQLQKSEPATVSAGDAPFAIAVTR